jgi:hypothetical protein
MAANGGTRRRRALAVWGPPALGILWGHASLAGLSVIEPLIAVPGGGIIDRWVLPALAWTLLLPLSLTGALALGSAEPLSTVAHSGLPAHLLPAPALVGLVLVTVATRLLHRSALRRLAQLGLGLAVVVSGVSAAVVWATLSQERAGERLFLRMVATDARPWEVPASRAAARTLVERYPRTRWASEAWRVLASDAESRGAWHEAADGWQEFGRCFGDQAVPGRALASFNVARLLEGRAPDEVVSAHYLDARRALARAGPEAQPWIAGQTARGLARLALQEGLYATSGYWGSRVEIGGVHEAFRTEGG